MGTEELIAEHPTYQVGDSPLRQMVRTIVDHVAAALISAAGPYPALRSAPDCGLFSRGYGVTRGSS